MVTFLAIVTGHTVHFLASYALIAGIVLQVIGALKHHVIDKDGTLRRMLCAEI